MQETPKKEKGVCEVGDTSCHLALFCTPISLTRLEVLSRCVCIFTHTHTHIYISVYIYLATPLGMQELSSLTKDGIQVPGSGSRVLTTGILGKSP